MTVSGGGADVIVYVAVPSAAVQDAAGRAGGLDAFLSPEERNASLRFRRAEDRLDYAASHALFRLLAAWRLGRAPEDAAVLDVRRTCAGCGGTDHGKPSVGGVAVSMSRSHGTVMAVAGPAGASLGADIERVPAEVFAGFDDFALAPEERPGPDGPELTDAGRIRLWVAKEAVLKAAGLGLAVDPPACCWSRRAARAARAVPPPAPCVRKVGATPRSTGSSSARSRHPADTQPRSPPPQAFLHSPCHLPRYSPLKVNPQTSNV